MDDSINIVIGKLKDYILKEVYEQQKKLFAENKEFFDTFDFLELDRFRELENLIIYCDGYIKDSLSAIDYFVDNNRDGFDLDNEYFENEIRKRIGDIKNSKFESTIKEKWLLDTIDFHSYSNLKRKAIIAYTNLISDYNDEFLIYKSKINLSEPNYIKIKCETDFSKICYVLRKLYDYGYFSFPEDINGNFDRIAIANILMNTFDTKVKASTIADYFGSKNDRMENTFVEAINISKDSELLKIPPAYKFGQKNKK
jgi:hypothetical protein